MNSELEHGNETTVGSLLRASRLRRDEDLLNVVRALRIRLLYLEAIEEARYSDLPGNAYAIGFIRAYAEHLGLDSEEVVRRYKLESSGDGGSLVLVFPSPVPENSVPGGAILFIGVLIALTAYGSWYVSSTQYGFLTDIVSPIPDRLASMTGDAKNQDGKKAIEEEKITASATVTPTISIMDKQLGKSATETNALSSAAAGAMEKANTTVDAPSSLLATEMAQSTLPNENAAKKEVIKAVEATRSVAPVITPEEEPKLPEINRSGTNTSNTSLAVEQAPAPKTVDKTLVTSKAKSIKEKVEASSMPSPNQPKVEQSPKVETPVTPSPQVAVVTPPVQKELILLRAKDDSWILIRDGNTNQFITRKLLRAGETYRVPNQKGLTLQAGNAGALEITVDGEAVPAIGAIGAVLKGVALDAERLREGKAVAQ
jgi:cytoskeleton protein RodZ